MVYNGGGGDLGVGCAYSQLECLFRGVIIHFKSFAGCSVQGSICVAMYV